MDPGGEVTRLELGGRARGRRWWALAFAALGVWIAAAVALSRGGEESAAPSTTTSMPPSTTTATTEPSTSTTRRPPTTTTTIPGAPLLGRPTGWTLLVGTRTVDLDTGAVTQVSLPRLTTSTADGVLTTSGDGGYRWWPFPFDEATTVELDVPATDGVVPLPATEEQLLWTRTFTEGVAARALSLTDGSVVGEVVLPDGTLVAGVVGRSVVAAGGGRLFRLGLDGSATDLGPGQPIAVVGRSVLLTSCDADLRCGTYAHDVDTGERREVVGLPAGGFATGPVSPSGWAVVDTAAQRSSLLGADGELRPLPEEAPPNAFFSAWTPDGEQLLVPAAGEILVVDPDVDGEARVVWRFDLPGATNGPLAVLDAPAG